MQQLGYLNRIEGGPLSQVVRDDPQVQRTLVPGKRAAGDAALALMDEHLAGRHFLVGDTLTLADICLYAYTHIAEGGGFDLAAYPAVQAWLKAVEGEPGYVAMDA